MRPFTNHEYESLPHVTMTSDKEWDPSIFDSDNEPTDDSFPPDLNQLPTEDYDVQDKYIRATQVTNNHDDNDTFIDDDVFEDHAVQDLDEDNPLDLFWISEHEYNHMQTVHNVVSIVLSLLPAHTISPILISLSSSLVPNHKHTDQIQLITRNYNHTLHGCQSK